jgi:phage-related protein
VKPLKFVDSSQKDLREMPAVAWHALGVGLLIVQYGGEPKDWRAMPTVGAGAAEIRYQDENGAFRVVYVARLKDAIYVLHAFQKKTQKTPKSDIELAARRYRKLMKG